MCGCIGVVRGCTFVANAKCKLLKACFLNIIGVDLQLVRSCNVLENLGVNRVIEYRCYVIVVVWAYILVRNYAGCFKRLDQRLISYRIEQGRVGCYG